MATKGRITEKYTENTYFKKKKEITQLQNWDIIKIDLEINRLILTRPPLPR